MKMKKMLAILAALSVLGTTGLTAGAEDATPTEPATETVTTTEPTEETTETQTTVAETTAVEEETVATEKNQTVQEKGTFEAGSKDYQLEQNGTVHNVKVVSQVDYETITTGVVVDSYLVVYVDGTQAGKFSMGGATLHDDYWKDKVSDVDIDNYFSVNGDVMNVTINNKTTAYRYDETSMTLIEANNTTETPADGIFVHGTKTYQMGEHALKVVVYYDSNEGDDLVERMSVYVDGVLSNLSGVAVTSALAGDGPSHEYRANVDNFFAVVDSDTVAVTSYGVTTKYIYDAATNTFVASTAPTTTAATTDGTTTATTTTVDPAETEEALRKIFEEYVAEKQAEDINIGGIKSFYYDAAAKKAYGVYGWNGSMHDDALCIITKDGVSEQHIDGTPGEFNSIDFKESVCFTCNGSTFIAAIVDIHHAVAHLYVLNIYDVNGSEPIKTNLYSIYIGNTIKDYAGLLITDPNSSIALDDYFTIKSDSVITVKGVDYTYDTESGQFVKVGSDSGKTDNGSASNAPASTATKNTSGTPKTGDTTTVPAVAIGLTLTAAGVVAVISKRKKK